MVDIATQRQPTQIFSAILVASRQPLLLMAFLLSMTIRHGERETQQAPHTLKANRSQKSHDSALESSFDVAILLLDPDAFWVEVYYFTDLIPMTGQITLCSHVGQHHPTEHLLFPPQSSLWNFHDLPFI